MAGTILVDHIQTNLGSYSVQEDATPLDPSDTTGGVGQIDFEAEYIEGPEGSIQLEGLDVELRDQWRGSTYGTIVDAALTDSYTVNLTANGRLGALVGTVKAKPMVDSLQNVLLYYLSLAGITDGIVIDPNIAFLTVSVPGFNDDLWLRTKQLVSVAECEITLVSNNVVVRPLRTIEADSTKQTSLLWHVEKGDAAQFVEVTYYGNTWVGGDVVYPYTDDERTSAQSFTVDEGAVLEDDITTSVSIESVEQPEAFDGVPQDYGQSSNDVDSANPIRLGSVYSVYDADNKAVSAQAWRVGGGSVELTVADDSMGLHVKITGAKGVGTGPYRLVGRTSATSTHSVNETKTTTDYNDKNTAKDNVTTTEITGVNVETSGDEADYNSLFIVGRGVAINPLVLRVPTGVAASTTVNEVGTTVQIPTVSDIDDAYRVGVQVAGQWAGAKLTASGTFTSVNSLSGSGEVKYRTFADFNTENNGRTIAQFNTIQGSRTFGAFNAAELALVKDKFDNQIFGNVAGSRFKYGDSMYRIGSATITDEDISVTAQADTTFDDFNTAIAGLTFGQINTRFTGKTYAQFNRIPLNKADSTGTIFVPAVPTDAFPDTFYPDQLYPATDPVIDPALIARVDHGKVDVNTVG